MGVECTAMTYVGVYTNDPEAYLVDKGVLKEGELEEKYGGDIGYYYVGFEVSPSDYKSFEGLIAKFKELTGDEADVNSFEHWH